jgi:nitrile hydratase subunit beta
MDAPHDIGGRPTGAAIPRDQHAFAPWEVRVDAIMMALTDSSRTGGPLMTVDQLRRGVESLSAEQYATLGYYQRWLRSLIAIMIERGAVDPAQLERRVAAIAEEHELEHAHETSNHR